MVSSICLLLQWRIAEVCQRLEHDLEILGVTAIEDRLQVNICSWIVDVFIYLFIYCMKFHSFWSMGRRRGGRGGMGYDFLLTIHKNQTWKEKRRKKPLIIKCWLYPIVLKFSGWCTRNNRNTKKSRDKLLDADWRQAEHGHTDCSLMQFYFPW